MKVYLVIAISCNSCNEMAFAVFDHEPTKEEIDETEENCGRMFCIKKKVVELELNGSSININQDE